jgi:hypothetical protein
MAAALFFFLKTNRPDLKTIPKHSTIRIVGTVTTGRYKQRNIFTFNVDRIKRRTMNGKDKAS